MADNKRQSIRAAFWMSGTVFSFSAMAVAGREASHELSSFEIMTYRSLIGMVIMLGLIVATGKRHQLRPQSFRLHLVRNILHFAATNLWFTALASVPLALVFAFEFTSPLWTAVLAPLILREMLPKVRIIATIIGFIGIMIIARPGIVEFSPGMIAAASCAIGFAGAAIATRKLTGLQPVATILFWMCAIQSVLGLTIAGADLSITLPSSALLVPILAVSLCGLSAHFCLTKALQIAPATFVMPLDFARLPAIAVVGFILYGETIDIFMIIGSLFILLANSINIRTGIVSQA